MGKTVLYLAAALAMGVLIVAFSMFLGFSAYAALATPDEPSPLAAIHALFTGFIFYLGVLWATQESLSESMSLARRVLIFLVSPIALAIGHIEWNPVLSLIGLTLIASLASYQMLAVTAAKRRPAAS